MPALINYQPTYQRVSDLYETVINVAIEAKPNWDVSILKDVFSTNVNISSFKDMFAKDATHDINENAIKALKNISLLEDNWDEEDAIAPSKEVIQRASGLISSLSPIGQEIYNIVPGFNGEIMIDIRNQNKSIEILFYPQKSKFVTFDRLNNTASQGVFDDKALPDLLNWVNNQQNAA
jgi:hypothetical protein